MVNRQNMQEYITLTRLLQGIRGAVADNFPVPVWVWAEIHDMKMHNNGHCYLELVEKGSGRDLFSAKVQAVIWRSRRSLSRRPSTRGRAAGWKSE